jgi:hypothetical protein
MNQREQIKLIGETQDWYGVSQFFETDEEFYTMHKNTVSLS